MSHFLSVIPLVLIPLFVWSVNFLGTAGIVLSIEDGARVDSAVIYFVVCVNRA